MSPAERRPYTLRFRRAWPTPGGDLPERQGWLLHQLDDDGLSGWGDCAPLPEFGIDQARALAYAEECAGLDLAAQHAGLPLNAFLSGMTAVGSLAVNAAMGRLNAVDRDQLAETAAAGFTVIKLKVGTLAVPREIALLHALAADLPAGMSLRLDANRAWRMPEAQEFIAACRGLPIDGLEEALAEPTRANLAQLQSTAGFPLAIDESTHLLDAQFFHHPAVDRIVLKPARHGLLASIELARRARAAGVEVIVTSALESACGLLAAAHVAAVVAPAAVHGLATGDCFSNDTGAAPKLAKGRLQLPAATGLGFIYAPT